MTGRLFQFAVCSMAVLGLLLAEAGAAGRQRIDAAPYRGTYDMKMRRADPSTGINGASGRMTIEWMDACTGYTLNQRIVTELGFREGEDMLTDLRVSTWESRNGNDFRFSFHNYVNGEPAEVSQGEAKRAADGSGRAAYTWPRGKEAQFPKGTVFPTTHGMDLVRAARSGQRSLTRILFDGAPDGALYRAVAFIGDKRRAERAAGKAEAPWKRTLDKLASWPVIVSYYRVGDSGEVPEYEVSYRLYENGISDQLLLDYGDMVFEASIAGLVIYDKPGC
jgi:hypothetical protein